jgi:hypothetical protein
MEYTGKPERIYLRQCDLLFTFYLLLFQQQLFISETSEARVLDHCCSCVGLAAVLRQ